ncbi:MAG: hypothetical protein P3X22_005830 [Thermoprotei archaeon]|nr:hypothetical protein [Thermoprotei archaeon]
MLRYFRKGIALAGSVGLALGFIFTLISLYLRLSYPDPGVPAVLAVTGVAVNIIVLAALSRVYSRLSGATWSWGVLIECGVAQLLAFLAFWAVLFDALS